jgi:hypothetical protein
MPHLRMCGGSGPARLDAGPLTAYLLSVLRGNAEPCPPASQKDWQALLEDLKAHWIKPLIHWHLRPLTEELTPPAWVVRHLHKSFLASSAACLRTGRQLSELLAAFDKQGIKALVLKGPALARTAYPHPATRPGCDLDLLVRPRDLVRGRETLTSLGYQCLGKRFESSRDFYKDEVFRRPGKLGYLQVELHWALHSYGALDLGGGVEPYFERAQPVNSPGLSFMAMEPLDALLHRAMSNAYYKDRDLRLIWLADVLHLCGQLDSAPKWQELQRRSLAQGMRLALEASLLMAQTWLDLQIPSAFADFAAWPSPSQAEVRANRKLAARHDSVRGAMGLHLSPDQPFSKRLRYLLSLLFPSPAYMMTYHRPAHKWLLPLAYAGRILKWLKRGGY